MAGDRNRDTDQSVQEGFNRAYDWTYHLLKVSPYESGGASIAQPPVSKQVASIVTTAGNITYVAKAATGSAQSAAVWQAKKIDATTGIVTTWADGDANFDNVATDLTSLTYA